MECHKTAEGKAIVYIFKPSGFSYAIIFHIWTGDRLIGLSQANSYFQYMVDLGMQTFQAISENKTFIEADRIADKLSYIVTTPKMGVEGTSRF